jgi:20S proteasome alpha/beta subunit
MNANTIESCSGLIPAAPNFTARSREEAVSWRQLFHDEVPVSELAKEMGQYAQLKMRCTKVQSLGMAAIFGGVDHKKGPNMWFIDHCGVVSVGCHLLSLRQYD